jgi:hypothetical protein
LLAFLPLFFIFLALCQVALLVAGRLVVSHAAFAGARSAIVVLDDDPALYDGAPRGVLSDGKGAASQSVWGAIARPLASEGAKAPQHGVRMLAIRSTAMRPLLAIAPSADAFFGGRDASIGKSLRRDKPALNAFGYAYTEAAAVVTVHDSHASSALASEPIFNNAPVTVRVTYLQLCAIPLVRSLICSSLATLLETPNPGAQSGGKARSTWGQRFELAGMPGWLASAAGAGSRFMVFEAEATLPNQGARYEYAEP